jgi:putative ABC transport system ATP-binding protein
VSARVLLEARQLVVEYARGRRVLDGVDLVLRPGESVAIVGPSGSGKSTLLAHLAGLRRPDGGEVRFEGRPLTSLASRELDRFRAGQLGFVFQRAALLPFLTVRENVCLALGCLGPRAPGESASRVGLLLESMGLAPLADRRADRLSVGEAQRVAVARALVKDPPLVLADEPTGSIDAAGAAAIVDLLLLHRADRHRADRTVVIATHDARVSARCERVLTVQGGRLV